MTTTISNLPSDLMEEVLSRVPMTREVRLTCKKWNDISKTQSFRKMHIRKAKEGESQMVAMMGYNLYSMSILVDGDPSSEPQCKLSCPNEQIKVSEVYHCEGLLLCILKDDPRVLVWNPYLREKRWIKHRYNTTGFRNEWDRSSYALGYENKKSCRTVKLLRFLDYEDQLSWYEMYDFDTGLWKALDITPHWRLSFLKRGVSLKGNTYWSATKRNTNHEDVVLAHSIICFDFTSERFGQLLPLPFTAPYNDFVALSCVREEKLAVLHHHSVSYLSEIEIWITNKTDVQEVSWSKFLRMETEFGIMAWIKSFFIDEEKKIAMCFDGVYHQRTKLNIVGDAGYFRQLNLLEEPAERKCMPHVCAYVPSLLQIEQPAGVGKRKRQSEL